MTVFNPGVIAPHLRQKLVDWAEERRGAVAVEFALIAIPFFFIVFGLLEVCLLFIMSTVLEHSISEASREIRTGQAQEAGFTEEEFRDSICSELFGLLDCGTSLHIDVRKLDGGFGSAATDTPLDANGDFDDSGFAFDPGGANDVVAVRVYYEWGLLTPIMSAPLANMAGNKHLIQANAVFRNEPFGD